MAWIGPLLDSIVQTAADLGHPLARRPMLSDIDRTIVLLFAERWAIVEVDTLSYSRVLAQVHEAIERTFPKATSGAQA